jgi:hypothetical protein
MIVMRYIRWSGTEAEFRDYAEKAKAAYSEVEGVSLLGVYEPYSEWHYVMMIEAPSNERFLEALHRNTEKNGRCPHISLIKADLLFPF